MISIIIAGISEVVKWLADEAATIAVVIWNVIKVISGFLVDFGVTVAKVFVKVWDFFGRFYTNVLRPFVSWTWNGIVKIHDWLKTTLTPILKFLNSVRADILKVYDTWLKPIFATIDLARSMLRVLEVFHVQFATKLDAQLGALEAKLLAPIRLALAKINEITNWVNRIIDLDGIFQRLTLIESQWRYAGDMWNVLLKHPPTGVSFEQNGQMSGRTVTPVDPKALSDDVTEYYTTGGGALASEIDANVAVWLASANNA